MFLLAGLFVFRLLGGLLLRTYFDPDEYWQCIEPAARLAFGQGALTWEWAHGIRSWNFPVLFALGMWISKKLTGAENALIVEIVPKVIQALITACIDYYTYKLALKISPKTAKRVLLISLSSWFMFAYVNRTLSNSLETALTAAALYHEGTARYVLIALSSIVRPTALVNWIGLLSANEFTSSLFIPLLTVQFWNCLLDSLFYGQITFVPFNFINFNLGKKVSEHFGVSSGLYYFSAALPAILLSYSFYFLKGCKMAPRLTVLHVTGPLIVYSVLKHKEIRFIMPIVPSLHIISALGIRGSSRQWFKTAFLMQLLAGLYFSTSFQSGPISLMKTLRKNPEWSKDVLFLMPCHSVPWIGYFQSKEPVEWRQLECDPTTLDVEGLDHSDHFYLDPERYLISMGDLPSTIISFGPLEELLKSKEYHVASRLSNGQWNPDSRRSGDILIWRKEI